MLKLIKVKDTHKRPALLFLNFTFAFKSVTSTNVIFCAIVGKLINVKDTRQVPTLLLLNFTFSFQSVTSSTEVILCCNNGGTD